EVRKVMEKVPSFYQLALKNELDNIHRSLFKIDVILVCGYPEECEPEDYEKATSDIDDIKKQTHALEKTLMDAI
ncbi:MAG: hypothetical protein FWD97_09590, partial [Defluviitaleaceae bacterium]|nr:hypothetical protein [Defluviitaleaceae bacterium]